MAGLTSAQRYNKRMDAIWEKGRELGAFEEKNLKRAREHEERMRKISKKKDAQLKRMIREKRK